MAHFYGHKTVPWVDFGCLCGYSRTASRRVQYT